MTMKIRSACWLGCFAALTTRFRSAGSVKEALEIFSSQPIEVILSDIGLPDGTGYDIISEAKRIRGVKGVALTGYGMSEDVRRSTEAGFDFHLTKPVDVAELRSVLRKLSSQASPHS